MSFSLVTTRLISAVADGETFTLAYPAGTSSTSFLGARGHRLTLNDNDLLFFDDEAFAVDFGDSLITITNSSGFAWAAMTLVRVQLTRTVQTDADGSIEGTDVDFDLDPLGINSSSDGLLALFTTASRQKRPCDVLPGTYRAGKFQLFEGLTDLAIRLSPGVVFLDPGRSVTGVNSTVFMLPWGTMFRDCQGLRMEGRGLVKTTVPTGGSSSGLFGGPDSALPYTLRNPVMGFYECQDVLVDGLGRAGSPGRGIAGAQATSIIAELGITPTPVEHAYWNNRNHMINFYECENARKLNGWQVPGLGDEKEQISFTGGQGLEWGWERHWNTGETADMASLGKCIGVRDMHIHDLVVKDPSGSSLVDIIGTNVVYERIWADIPNGKVCDVSHEWSLACQAMDNVVLRDIWSTGRYPVCAAGATTQATIEATPITGVVMDNVVCNVGATDFSSSGKARGIQMSTVAEFKAKNLRLTNVGPSGVNYIYGGGQKYEYNDCSFEWTTTSANLDTSNRNLTTGVLGKFINCDFKLNTSQSGDGNGIAVMNFTTNGSGVVQIDGGSFVDATIGVTNGVTIIMTGVRLEDFAYSVTSGSITFINCTLDGEPFNSTPPEYADDAAAASGGIAVGGTYRTGSALKVRVS